MTTSIQNYDSEDFTKLLIITYCNRIEKRSRKTDLDRLKPVIQ